MDWWSQWNIISDARLLRYEASFKLKTQKETREEHRGNAHDVIVDGNWQRRQQIDVTQLLKRAVNFASVCPHWKLQKLSKPTNDSLMHAAVACCCILHETTVLSLSLIQQRLLYRCSTAGHERMMSNEPWVSDLVVVQTIHWWGYWSLAFI